MISAPFRRILLVEDELNLAIPLRIALQRLSSVCDHATTLEDARTRIAQVSPDLIVLDRALPDGDGLDLCAELRASEHPSLVLVLTAIGDVDARVDGLNAGADDYLAKPFSWQELEARVRALARRKPGSAGSETAWEIDDSRLRIRGPRGWTDLTPLEFRLALRLMSADGAIVTREALLKDVWGFTLLPKTRTVDHFLGRLRKAFERDPEEPRHFLTVRGAGYRFES